MPLGFDLALVWGDCRVSFGDALLVDRRVEEKKKSEWIKGNTWRNTMITRKFFMQHQLSGKLQRFIDQATFDQLARKCKLSRPAKKTEARK
jgi:hypothetical protein